jgi:predicted nucleic acid-binding protein
MSHVADTSFLVAFFDADDARHQASRKALAAARPVVIPVEVLVELLGVLKVKAGRPASLAALDSLLRIPTVEWDERGDVVGAYERMRSEAKLSFVDAAAIQCALRRGARLLSYDEPQVKAFERCHSP